MAQTNAAKAERDNKVESTLRFSSSILSKVHSRAIDLSFAAELRSRIYSLPITTSTARMLELEDRGTELWNLATSLRRDQNVEANWKNALCLLRIFAFFLIDSSYSDRVHSLDKCVRLLKIAFKSAEDCFDQQDLGFAVKVLGRAARYVEIISNEITNVSPDDVPVCERLKAEYFFQRITLAWKQSKLDVAEHMFKNATSAYRLFDPSTSEKFGKLLYKIGKDSSARKHHDIATRWLERAYDILTEQYLDHLNDDASELKVVILQRLVKSLLALQTDEDTKKAKVLIDLMEKDYPDKSVVSSLRLALLSKQQSQDPEAYFSVTMRFIGSMMLTKPNFKLLMYHIHSLRKLDSSLACKALDELLSLRLFPTGNDSWVERATVMRVWISILHSNEQDQIPTIAALMGHLDLTLQNVKYTFSKSGAHAAQTLIWKQIESAYNEQRQYKSAQAWCHIALHPLFANGGNFNKAKICRKIVLSSLACGDFDDARVAFFSMTDVDRPAPQSQYLLFKLASCSGDAELAASSLENLANSELEEAAELLHACVLETQKARDKNQITAALLKVLESYNCRDEPGFLRWSLLLRSTIRMLEAELENELKSEKNLDQNLIEEICKTFEAAARKSHEWHIHIEKNLSRCKQFRIACEWFLTNCFNIAVGTLLYVHHSNSTRLCRSSIDFINILLPGPKVGERGMPGVELELYGIQAHYMAAIAYVTLAREEGKTEASLHYYRNVGHHGGCARKAIETVVKKDISEHTHTKDWIVKNHFDVLVYELEALMHLKSWNRLFEFCEYCLNTDYDAFDMASSYWPRYANLSIKINEQMLEDRTYPDIELHKLKGLWFLQEIINRMYKENREIKAVCRWIRCLFQITVKSNWEWALQCLDQAADIARKQKNTNTPFDPYELSWLATTSFNHGMDLYNARDEKNCRLWSEKALTLAAEATDDGNLVNHLREKFATLIWEGDTAMDAN